MIDWSTCSEVERDPERVGGAWVFRGTRLPISTLFENLEAGASAQDYLEWFQGVTLDQVRALDWSGDEAAIDAAIAAWFMFGPSEIAIDE